MQQELVSAEDNNTSDAIDESRGELSSDENIIRSCRDVIPTEEHNYIMQQQCVLPAERLSLHEEIQENVPELEQDTVEYQEISSEQKIQAEQKVQTEQNQEIQTEQIQKIQAQQIHETQVEQNEEIQAELKQEVQAGQDNQAKQNQNDKKELFKEEVPKVDNEPVMEQESSQNETRRSKRRLARRTFTERDSDEENYFENLNLSSRLRKAQADKIEKIFFMCYLCDKQFLSKSVLKEHMHSHEEVRKALSLRNCKKYRPAFLP